MLPLAGCLPRLLDFQPHFGEAQTLPVDRGRGGPIAQELDSVIRRTGPALPKATEGIVRWNQLLFSLHPDGKVMSQISLLTVNDFPRIPSLIYALTQQTRCLYQTHLSANTSCRHGNYRNDPQLKRWTHKGHFSRGKDKGKNRKTRQSSYFWSLFTAWPLFSY